MKTQLKKGVIEIFVLAFLSKQESYGYEIVTELSNYVEITESTLYPILRRLEKAEELTTYNQVHNGRNRKYYQIKAKGYLHIEMFLKEWDEIKKVYDIIMDINQKEKKHEKDY